MADGDAQPDLSAAPRPSVALDGPGGWLGSGLVAAVGIAPLLSYAAQRAALDLDPPALWLDDAWVVALARSSSLGSLLVSAAAPPGFLAIIRAVVSLAPDLELGAQLFPFVCGLVAIALTGLLAFRLTSNAAVAIVAAAFIAFDPVLSIYMARVKPYASDVLVVVSLGLAFHALVVRYSRPRLWGYVAVVVVGLGVSSLSIFAAAAGTAVLGAQLWLRGERDPQIGWAAALVLAVGIATLALSSFAPGLGALREFWWRFYLPTSPLPFTTRVFAVATGWVARLVHGGPAQVGPLPFATALGCALAVLGGLQLWLSARRPHVAVGGLVVVCACIASAAQRLPLGAARIETFLMPFVAVSMACSIGLATRLRDRRLAAAVSLAFVAAALLQLPYRRAAAYPLEVARPVAEQLVREYRAGDGIWMNLEGTYAFALYSGWATARAPNPNMGFDHLEPAVPDFVVMNIAARRIDTDPPATPRVFVFVCHDEHELRRGAIARLASAGYASRLSARRAGCSLELMVRSGAPSEAGTSGPGPTGRAGPRPGR